MSPALRGLGLGLFFLVASLGAVAQTLTPSGDAHVRGGAAANNNYGGVVLLGVRTANNELNTYWSYLKFDTSGISGQVREAKLRLLVALSSSGSVQTNLYAAPATWGETTITWNNKPALGAQLGSFTVANTGYVWFELDVTAHVRAELAQGAVGFALVNPAVSSQLVAVQSRESSNSAQLLLAMNTAPSVTLTSPANGTTYIAPATVSLAASATDTDGTIAKVEFFHGGTNLIATVTAAPYTFDWTNVAAGSYSLTAKATDDLNSTTTSAPVGITVSAAVGQLYFIHADHLNTPRLVADATGTTVWRWDQAEPFGNNPANEDPDGNAIAFDLPLRLPGQYFDKETNTHYNYFRDYDPGIGRYIQSDPIGLDGGLNTYAYASGDPLFVADPLGLLTRPVPGEVRGPDAGAREGGACGVRRTRNGRNFPHSGVDLLHPAGGAVVSPIPGVAERSGPEGVMVCGREGQICCGGKEYPRLSCYRLVHVVPTVTRGAVQEGQTVATVMPQTNPNIPPHVHVELYETECDGNNPKLKRKCPPFR